MAGDVKLKIGADTSELEKAFSTLIKKIQSDADKLKIAPKGASTAPGAQPFQQAFQANRAQVQKTRDEKDGIEIATRALAQKKRQLDEITKSEAISLGNKKQEAYWAEKRNKAEKEYNDLMMTRGRLQKSTSAGAMPGQMGGGGGGKGPGAVPAGGITSLGGLASFLGVPAAIVGGLATGVASGSAAEGIRKYFVESSYRAREIEGSAFQTQGQGGQRLQALLNGGAAEESTFNPVRNQAARLAEEQMKGRLESSFRIFSRPLQTILGRAGNGYEAGNQFGFGTEDSKRRIDAEQQQERADLQAKQFEALKNGPEGALRTTVANSYLRDWRRDLDFQRQTGLSDTSFRGKFKNSIFDAGFSDVQGMGMASSIMGAGGSTRGATGSAAFALQAQRNLDMTNAGSIIGKLSGSMGSSQTTNESFVKILAEGTRMGLDGSEYREENRKFVESAAQVISQSGVTSAAGVDQLMSQFGKFFGDKTGVGIEAGKSAFELYRQTSMATTGPRGTMRAAGILTNPTLNQLDRDERMALFDMPIDQLVPENPVIQSMAKSAHTTAQNLIDQANKVTRNSANQFKRSDVSRDRLAAVKQKYGVSSAIGFQGPLSVGAYDELSDALGQSMTQQIKEHPELGQNFRMNQAFSDAQSRNDTAGMNKALEEAKKNQITSGTPTGRAGDETERMQGEASRLANQLFVDMRAEIVPTAAAVGEFAKQCMALRAILNDPNSTAAQKSRALTDFNAGNPGAIPTQQPSAGSPPSGGGSAYGH